MRTRVVVAEDDVRQADAVRRRARTFGRTVGVHVVKPRSEIEPNQRRPACLLTVHGGGYQLTDGSR